MVGWNKGPLRWPSACLAGVMALALGGAAVAQDTAPAEDAAEPAVVVAMAGFTLVPALDEDGAPLLDEDGNPIILRLPLAESVITPGDAVLYVIALDNQTADIATDLQIGAQVAAEVLLDPHSVIAPEGLAMEWADAEAPETFRPVFEEIEGEIVMVADLETIRTLRLTLPTLDPGATALVEYTVTLR